VEDHHVSLVGHGQRLAKKQQEQQHDLRWFRHRYGTTFGSQPEL
jgi:hypothetical protein